MLLERIASGGMAEVWLSLDRQERPCAIKRILAHLCENDAFITMFLNEARLASKLKHENVVGIRDLSEHEGVYFVAMEYVDGYNLREVAEVSWRSGAMPSRLAATLAAEACLGLQHAHELTDSRGRPLGIVHRDVTPENIMISRWGQTRLLDFGVAKANGEIYDPTHDAALQGKFRFMAPELIRKRTADSRSDLFSLGVVLYWLITKHHPFEADSQAGILGRILHEKPPAPSDYNSAIDERLSSIILHSLNKEPEDRYQSAGDMREALLKYLGGETDPGMLGVWLRGVATVEDGCAPRSLFQHKLTVERPAVA